MKLYIVLCFAVSAIVGATDAQTASATLNKPWREVNITTDSAKGWLPSEAEFKSVTFAVQRYFAAIDNGEYKQAYDMMAPIDQQNQTYDEFAKNNRNFLEQAGSTKQRTVLKITWTKDPADAPFPGIYVAVDIAGKFANIDRECGYLVFYQKSENDDFKLMREESNFISNADAKDIERTKSRATLDQLWTSLSTNCPNYSAN
ncbi:DUF4019 domain-containing protein [Asticcacaulis sp. EMRT-3]|uniref:DUF4019 domain-containing protein n=1 Tax=Asticcacaulis sp. EMRT-3 TaxID=3040349 RepID=UPI0024AEDE89|nr:DUF4019 domain-containing protein [Asticcacaulis sp. EMRT-3]MDI7776125.1 DUF4019 domain-containing protein [Asticcacaulis sp. EMRT-3]